jgi:Mg2+ and Co2+ transporter CorA
VETVQWQLSRKQDLACFDISTTEEQWSDVQAWERRLAEYQDDLEGIMLQIGIPLMHSPDSAHLESSSDARADFQYLFLRYREIRQRVNMLAGAVTALANLAGNRAAFKTAELSLKEAERAGRGARSVRALTSLGLIFLPLSFSASLFSMSDRYAPGGPDFWIYFVVSFPLLCFVALVYSFTELGFKDSETEWSFKILSANIRKISTQRAI